MSLRMRLSISLEPDSTPTSSRRSPALRHFAQTSSGRRTPWSARIVPAQLIFNPISISCSASTSTRSRRVKKVSSWKFTSSKRYRSHNSCSRSAIRVGSRPTHLRPYTKGSEQKAQRKWHPWEEMKSSWRLPLSSK